MSQQTQSGTADPSSVDPNPEYNFSHFRTRHVVEDLWRTVKSEGIQPGETAPDFELESTRGERIRLSSFKGRPVYIRFANFT